MWSSCEGMPVTASCTVKSDDSAVCDVECSISQGLLGIPASWLATCWANKQLPLYNILPAFNRFFMSCVFNSGLMSNAEMTVTTHRDLYGWKTAVQQDAACCPEGIISGTAFTTLSAIQPSAWCLTLWLGWNIAPVNCLWTLRGRQGFFLGEGGIIN